MNSSEGLQQNEINPIKRPEWLTYLCILSFIGSGLAAVSNLFIFFSYDSMINLTDELNIDLPEFDLMMSGGKKFFLTGFIFYGISLSGALMMWKLKRIGFHFYTVAQIFLLIVPVIFIQGYPFSFMSVLLTGAFILGYGIHLKFMT